MLSNQSALADAQCRLAKCHQCQADVNGEYTPRCTRSQCTTQNGAGGGDRSPPFLAARRAESL
eukprot:12511247-Alexandrium_andersonii.AAC.1